MKNSILSKNKKRFKLILILSLFLTLSSISPTFAKEKAKTTIINSWSVNDLVDAKRQGIFNNEMQKEDLREIITKEELNLLIKNSEDKLNSYNLEKNPNYKKLDFKEDFTRNHIINEVFDLVQKYDTNATNKDPAQYLMEKKILKGNGKNLFLNNISSYENAISFFTRANNYLIQQNNLGSKGMFYKIENNGNTIYILGSIHIGDNSMYPIDEKVIDAFNSSNELYVEVNVTDQSKMKYIQEEMFYKDNTNLKDSLGDNLYNKYKLFMDKYFIEENNYINLKPWAAYNMLSNLPMNVKMPNSSDLGIDRYFITKAKLNNKTIKELETIELQTNVLSSLSDEDYKNMINSFLDAANSYGIDIFTQNSEDLKNIWKSGNDKELNLKINKGDKFSNNLFDKRDIGMAEKITDMLNSKNKNTIFVVAGAAHFTPEDSVIKLLENNGFTIQKL